ncbi:hypothetical protein X757_09685 [Mesorhizobium sp. LSHC414A00]|nr:hypothetical protein X757_09685 [Mesorhizobium sp. LSHC414A00]
MTLLLHAAVFFDFRAGVFVIGSETAVNTAD